MIPKEEHKAVPKDIERPKTQENPEPPKETKEEEDRDKCELYPDECD